MTLCSQEPTTVHPHACGEHNHRERGNSVCPGSSPRLWGTPDTDPGIDLGERFIPTPVGNTSAPAQDGYPESVHPHACGEHHENFRERYDPPGSSPRLWGTLPVLNFTEDTLRFIPTPVGNTRPLSPGIGIESVHPHACGEHRRDLSGWWTGPGSSPRLWGTHHFHAG